MKKIISVLLCGLVVCSLGLAACGNKTPEPAPAPQGGSSDVPAPQASSSIEPESDVPTGPMPGGWTISDLANQTLNEDEQEIFNKASEGYTGNNLTPIAVLATQVVAGTNLAYLCTGTIVVPDAQPEWDIVVVYHDLEDNAEITNVQTIDLTNIKTVDSAGDSNVVGGWTVKEPGGKPVMLPSEEAQTAFDKAAAAYTDVDLKPIALLGTQVVAGMNYKVLCDGVKDGQTNLYIVDIYQDLEGNAEVTDAQIFDLLAYVSK